MALGKRAWRWIKRAWHGAIVKVARGNTKPRVSLDSTYQFQDVPYLDLCVYPPDSQRHRAGTLEAAVQFDKLSLCSMDSVCVAPSRPLAQVLSLHY